MTTERTLKKSVPKVSYAEYSGYIHAKTTQEVCTICGSEARSILRKALNA